MKLNDPVIIDCIIDNKKTQLYNLYRNNSITFDILCEAICQIDDINDIPKFKHWFRLIWDIK